MNYRVRSSEFEFLANFIICYSYFSDYPLTADFSDDYF